jgi:hypothetical protein
MTGEPQNSIARMEALGKSGIVVSVCFGPAAGAPCWSVTCMHGVSGAEFDRPFGARDFAHCVEIAEIEAKRRGWIR